MAAERFSTALAATLRATAVTAAALIGAVAAIGAVAVAAPGTARAATPAADHSQPFSVQDMVRLDRVSEITASPDGKRVAYTLRTTDMEANKGRTAIWLLDTAKRAAEPQRLTDLAANSNSAE